VAEQRKSWLHSFLVWGRADGYFTREQTQLLDEYRWAPPPKAIIKPTRSSGARTNGEGSRFITPAEVPSHDAVRALADAQQNLWPQGQLFVELAAASPVFAVTPGRAL
jgi:hypothetical protein